MEEHINFTVYVKRNIINEDNDYRTEYDFIHTNVPMSYKGTFKTYFETNDVLSRFDIKKDDSYGICVDVNGHHNIDVNCQMIRILTDDATMKNVSQVPYGGAKAVRYLQIVPDKERWFKYVLLDDEQIEEAKKLMWEIEEHPLGRATKKRRGNTD